MSDSFKRPTASLCLVLLCALAKLVACLFCRLMEHEDDPDIDEPNLPPAENVQAGKDENKPTPEEPTLADTAEGQGEVWLLEAAKVSITAKGRKHLRFQPSSIRAVSYLLTNICLNGWHLFF